MANDDEFYCLACLYYLPGEDDPSSGWPLIFGILLYGAEVWGFLQFLIFCYVSTQEKQEVKLDTSRTSLPSIDVIIPTYGEPIYILKRTLAR